MAQPAGGLRGAAAAFATLISSAGRGIGGGGAASASASSSSAASPPALSATRRCLPCLDDACAAAGGLTQARGDYCGICYVEALHAQPCIQLACKHIFHLDCCRKKLQARWSGSRITFVFAECATCRVPMAHWALDDLLAPLRALQTDVEAAAVQRLRLEGLERAPDITAPGGRFFAAPLAYAMDRYAFAACDSCGAFYFVGMRACGAAPAGGGEGAGGGGGGGGGDAAGAGARDASARLLCAMCTPPVPGVAACPVAAHGTKHLVYKCKCVCARARRARASALLAHRRRLPTHPPASLSPRLPRYCCSPSTWWCWGTTHFCEPCHAIAAKKRVPPVQPCPGAAKCPLKLAHVNGVELALGCEACKLASIGVTV